MDSTAPRPGPTRPAVLLDMATGFPSTPDHLPSIFKGLGLQAAVVALGGVVAGIYQSDFLPGNSEWESNQGAISCGLGGVIQTPLCIFCTSRRNMSSGV